MLSDLAEGEMYSVISPRYRADAARRWVQRQQLKDVAVDDLCCFGDGELLWSRKGNYLVPRSIFSSLYATYELSKKGVFRSETEEAV